MFLLDTVSVSPSNPVTSIGTKNYTFTCLFTLVGSERVSWLLNGSSLESLELDDVDAVFEVLGTNIVGCLTFRNLIAEYNETVVQCRGHVQSGRTHISEGVLLLLQGMSDGKQLAT